MGLIGLVGYPGQKGEMGPRGEKGESAFATVTVTKGAKVIFNILLYAIDIMNSQIHASKLYKKGEPGLMGYQGEQVTVFFSK
jgi:hypothetical protein